MSQPPTLQTIQPTVLLQRQGPSLRQQVRVRVSNPGPAISGAVLVAEALGERVDTPLGALPGGESMHEAFVPVVDEPTALTCALLVNNAEVGRLQANWQPPRRFRVHVVQRSHHDVGYTNLPSRVLREHDEYLAAILEMADATRDYPPDSQFRLTIEQAWSLDHFLQRADPASTARLVDLLQEGRVELTALFGNMTSEICGSETLCRALYHAARLARQYGLEITTAEHNDVPGISWGLAQVLAEVGVELFLPHLPRYYHWGHEDLQSFWDDKTIFPQGQPGAFWWETAAGKRLLVWDNWGFGGMGSVDPRLEHLADALSKLQETGCLYDVLRYPVLGGARDNAPYIIDYADSIRAWNEQWEWPQLICSTNALFSTQLREHLPADLPVWRGELPGQDYPTGATSTAEATATNRLNHTNLPAAESLATVAGAVTDYAYQDGDLWEAWEEVLWYDEHTWGHHFPCGPTARAHRDEKTVHAFRGAALAHDVLNKALARIADHVQLSGANLHVIVFNTLPYARTAPVSLPLREIDNCGSTMGLAEDGVHLRGYLLGDRWHINPPWEIVESQFDLVDIASGEVLPYQLEMVATAEEARPYAPERAGLGQGTPRYGLFEHPGGLAREVRFVARDLPALGYRTYQLRPSERQPDSLAVRPLAGRVTALENEFYRVTADTEVGQITSIVDKETGQELLDSQAPHPFGALVVRDPEPGEPRVLKHFEIGPVVQGPVCGSLDLTGSAPGHPQVHATLSLCEGVKRLDFAVRVLKDPTPLLDVHLAFPFLMPEPRFQYEAALSHLEPVRDFLPGAYWDSLPVQTWVRVNNDSSSILWSSLETGQVALGNLWPGYISPAHSACVTARSQHGPTALDELQHGWLYSNLFSNNFGTNFSCSQAGSFLFRYVIGSTPGVADEMACSRFGLEATTLPETIFTRDLARPRALPASQGFLSVSGAVLLALKQAEDGAGIILRLWNPLPEPGEALCELGFMTLGGAWLTSVVEEDIQALPVAGKRQLRVPLGGYGLQTVRVLPA